MICIFDCETTGLLRKGSPAEDPSQPHLCQLGASLFTPSWRRVGHMAVLIKPEGWAIEEDAERHHGISLSDCQRYGVPLVSALAIFKGLVSNAYQIAAHNMEFDRKIVSTALYRAGSDGLWWKKLSRRFECSMERSTPVLQLPGEYGSFKYPSLKEAVEFMRLGETFEETHDAEHDIEGCRAVIMGLQERGLWPKASIAA